MPETRSQLLRQPAVLFAILLLATAGCAAFPPHVDRLMAQSDRKLLVEATQKALENNKTGESTNWTNPATNVRGTVTPFETYERGKEPPCRDFRVTVTVQEKTHEGTDTACRLPSGAWKSVNHPGLAGARVFEGLVYTYTGGRYLYDYPRYPYHDPYYYEPYYYPRMRFGFGYHHYRWH